MCSATNAASCCSGRELGSHKVKAQRSQRSSRCAHAQVYFCTQRATPNGSSTGPHETAKGAPCAVATALTTDQLTAHMPTALHHCMKPADTYNLMSSIVCTRHYVSGYRGQGIAWEPYTSHDLEGMARSPHVHWSLGAWGLPTPPKYVK